jgi:septal ring factor EnvC (AmiA/AmiB activator)
MPSPTGFLITFCIGVAAVLGWQSYGDAAREMIASSYPQLAWVAPQPASAPSDQQQLNAMSLDAVRQSIDRIATSFAAGQEQMTRSIDGIAPSIVAIREQMTRSIDRIAASQEEIARTVSRLTASQEQMTREITKLQEISQYALYKNLEPQAQPGTPPARKPVPRSPQAPTALTPARNP